MSVAGNQPLVLQAEGKVLIFFVIPDLDWWMPEWLLRGTAWLVKQQGRGRFCLGEDGRAALGT